jgi:hypothetical protein
VVLSLKTPFSWLAAWVLLLSLRLRRPSKPAVTAGRRSGNLPSGVPAALALVGFASFRKNGRDYPRLD